MRRIARWLLLSLACASLTAAAADPSAHGRRIEELMHKSGLWVQVGQFQAQVKEGVADYRRQAQAGSGRAALTDEEFARVVAAIGFAFAPDRLRTSVAREMAAALSVEDEDAALAWLSSDLGQRITRLEEESGASGAARRFEEESPAVLAKLSPERLDKCRRLAESARAGEAAARIVIDMSAAILYGAAVTGKLPGAELLDSLRREFEARRPQLEREYADQAIRAYAYNYRALSDEDLERYVAFAESPAGRRYHGASQAALDAALTRASLEMGERLGRSATAEKRRESRGPTPTRAA
ncbi:MAG TPA: hypothetical protein VEG27_13300 [Usitatibacter sp.]|nr:hypothetical protein [Usitatibacter sp.]